MRFLYNNGILKKLSFFSSMKGLLSWMLCLLVLVWATQLHAQDGKTLFKSKCASCHSVDKDLTGPALKGMLDRVGGDKDLLFAWIRNNKKVLASGNKYYNDLYKKWNQASMNLYPELTDADLEAILEYVETWAPPVKKEGAKAAEDAQGAFAWLLWGIVVGVGIYLLLVNLNSRLHSVAEESMGLGIVPKIPFYRKKRNLAFAVFVLVLVGTYFLVSNLIEVGRDQGYTPRQPIFYSHKVHAGINKIDCQFCHTGVMQSSVASLPSVQTCMTCHMAIDEYKGTDLYTLEGELVDGSAEIQKLYQYAGWNPKAKKYDKPARPVEWIRVHYLPDHVAFSHENHVKNGALKCEQCHGNIMDMHEVSQASDLSMGFCVNCHRQTEVQLDNPYYGMYEQLHKALKEGKIKGVSADMIGANECQKCHY